MESAYNGPNDPRLQAWSGSRMMPPAGAVDPERRWGKKREVQQFAGVESKRTVLLVDDRDASRLTTKWFLANFGFSVDTARNGEEALVVFDPKVHDIVLTDNTMPGMSGSEMAHIVKLRSPETPVLMYTGKVPQDISCVDQLILKPAHLLQVKDALDQLMGNRAMK